VVNAAYEAGVTLVTAAACWLQKNRDEVLKYSKKWMRVEAVRQALYSTASNNNREHFGRGTLRADKSMEHVPLLRAAASKSDKTNDLKIGWCIRVV
jgi:hypothetical protein